MSGVKHKHVPHGNGIGLGVGTRGERKVPPHPVRLLVAANVTFWMAAKRVDPNGLEKLSGVSAKTIRRLCHGQFAATLDTLGAVADSLGVDIQDLLQERHPLVRGSMDPAALEVAKLLEKYSLSTAKRNRKIG